MNKFYQHSASANMKTWTEKTDNDKRKRIFPISQTAIDAASNLEGYLKQNEGY